MKKYLLLPLLFITSNNLFSQSIKSMEFHDQEISDILLVLAETSGTSIIADETVSGKASFYFSDSSLDVALNNFLSTYKLFYEKKDNHIIVSKIMISYNKDSELASIKAESVPCETIFRKLSNTINKTILYDTFPTSPISLDIIDLPIKDILEICIKKHPDFTIETTNSYYYINKKDTKSPTSKITNIEYLKKAGNLYSINLEKGRFIDIIQKLFKMENIEYSLFIQSDTQIENLYFQNKDFHSMLKLILEHGNSDFIEKDGIYYIIDLQKKGISAKLKDTHIISLQWISAQDIMSLLPSELSSSSVIRINKNNNSIFLTGTDSEITPIINFIKKIDKPLSETEYRKIDFKYINAKEALSLIPTKIIPSQPVLIPNTNSILALGTNEALEKLESFIDTIDVIKSGLPIKLKYIQKETLLKNLPPSITQDDLIDSGFPNLLFYKGSEENKQLFLHELNQIDKPHPQIKYQLLVIQYTDSSSSSLKPSINVSPFDSSSNNFIFDGELSNIMNLSFDIIANFGYQFAANLNARISDNTANVFTDTTLTAISGQEVKFQNTDTYRYIEYDYDSSASTRSSITQQITSGLIVGLNGWISGDNMITMTVNATVSKQNGDSSSSTSSTATLPSTSERVVTTQVRTMSGEPVVISGLIKEDISESKSRVPFLGRIPLLGNLFKHKTKSKEKTEIVIYIVPHLIQDNGSMNNDSLNIERYYQTFLEKEYAN